MIEYLNKFFRNVQDNSKRCYFLLCWKIVLVSWLSLSEVELQCFILYSNHMFCYYECKSDVLQNKVLYIENLKNEFSYWADKK